MGFFW